MTLREMWVLRHHLTYEKTTTIIEFVIRLTKAIRTWVPKHMIRWMLSKAMSFVLYKPELASKFVKLLTYFPHINKKLISFATNAGLITSSHAPVPRKGQETYKEAVNTLVSRFDDDLLVDSPSFRLNSHQASNPKGKNHEEKSPLEKWFY